MDFPEAPASLTYKVVYKGIEVLVTKRDLNTLVKPFLEDAKVGIDWALENGFTAPVARGGGFPKKEVEYVPGKKCPKCGGRLVAKESKAGKKYHACENGKYDFTTKTTTGCNYVDWLQTPEEFQRYVNGNEQHPNTADLPTHDDFWKE